MATVDVRPIIAAGQEPFQAIMPAVSGLGDDEEMVVMAPFEPVPRQGVLSLQGFDYQPEEIDGGDWRVTFRRQS